MPITHVVSWYCEYPVYYCIQHKRKFIFVFSFLFSPSSPFVCFLFFILFCFLLMDIFIFSGSACIFGVKAVCVLCIVLLMDFLIVIFSYSWRIFGVDVVCVRLCPHRNPIIIIIPVHLHIPTRSLFFFELTFMPHSFIFFSTIPAYRLSTDISLRFCTQLKIAVRFKEGCFGWYFGELATVLEGWKYFWQLVFGENRNGMCVCVYIYIKRERTACRVGVNRMSSAFSLRCCNCRSGVRGGGVGVGGDGREKEREVTFHSLVLRRQAGISESW